METKTQEILQNELKIKRICRFCLCQNGNKLSNIYMRDTRIKTSAPLPIQIMAIASIEVFTNDGMPSYICTYCTQYFEYSYQFKQMCKKADNLLRQVPFTGKWPAELDKPTIPGKEINATIERKVTIPNENLKKLNQTTQVRIQSARATKPLTGGGGQQIPQESNVLLNAAPKKILNADPSDVPEPPTPVRTKVETIDDEATANFLNKIENDDELFMDDVQRLIASEVVEETEFVNMNSLPVVVVDTTNTNVKPKLLNKSSVRILNKEAAKELEPRLSLPKVKQDEDGNVEIVAEILNADEPYENEADPMDAAPVQVNVFPCSFCERSFPLRQLRDIHIKNHSRERNYLCIECNKSFFTKYDLQKHVLTHKEDKPYKCSACDKSFTRSTLLYRHERSHTDMPKYICVHCEKPFLSSEDLEKHVARHNKSRPFKCKLCHKAFAFKQGLERHEVVHSRQQPFPCQYCNQSFSTTSKLARHLTAHAGERPYPCKFCSKSYLLSHHLTRHMRSHKNARHSATDFKCNSCNETFDSRDSLIVHSANHAKDESLSCPLCKESFDDFEIVTAHIKEHSDGEAYACEFCDLIFLSGDKLSTHTQSSHNEEMRAYNENDKAQAEKREKKKPERNNSDVNEDLQQTVNAFFIEEVDENARKEKIDSEPIDIKTEPTDSPKIINQVIISKVVGNVSTVSNHGEDYDDDDDDDDDDNQLETSLLVPMKLRKLDVIPSETAKVVDKTMTLRSPPTRRKVANGNDNNNINEIKQPQVERIQQLKLSKDAAVNKTSTAKQRLNETVSSQQASLLQKTNQRSSAVSTTSAMKNVKGNNDTSNSDSKKLCSMSIDGRTVKAQKITVTKAEAAALAREGRISYRNGNMILRGQQSKRKNK
uniref:Protein krueppel n=1 Tax=Glossina brevipalpis TaxID=37001 RepID=A0A1A9W9L4_9MUSC